MVDNNPTFRVVIALYTGLFPKSEIVFQIQTPNIKQHTKNKPKFIHEQSFFILGKRKHSQTRSFSFLEKGNPTVNIS